MEQQLALLNVLIIVMFTTMILLILCLAFLMMMKERKEEKQRILETKRIESSIISNEVKKSEIELENVKLQIKYEEMFKNAEKQGMSLAKSANDVLNEVGRGDQSYDRK